MTEIVVVYQDENGHHYKPMGTSSITKDVKSELKKNKDAKYSICQTANLAPKDGDSPDENGYYLQSQLKNYETVDIKDGGEFIKKPTGKQKYFDHKNNAEIEV